MFRNRLNQIEFSLRKDLWGNLVLRPGLPKITISPQIKKEREFYSLLLGRLFPSPAPSERKGRIHIIDVGCRNGSYLKAIADFFPNSTLTAVELDGGRRYWNLYRRRDYIQAFIDELQVAGRSAEFWEGNFLDLHLNLHLKKMLPSHAIISFFYPFVSPRPCLKWGLPSHFSDFAALLRHALVLPQCSSLTVVSAHQGEWEAEIARANYSSLELSFKETIVDPEEFRKLWPSRYPSHLFTAQIGIHP